MVHRSAHAFLRSFKAQLRDLGTSVRILKPVDSIDANEAIQLLKRHAIKHGLRRSKFRDLAEEWIDRWQEQHRSVSLAKLFDEYLETRLPGGREANGANGGRAAEEEAHHGRSK